jgi:chemotaxis protein MotB
MILALLGRELGKLPNLVRVEGYTDARPYSGGTTYSNWELSADRANVSRRILTENGLPQQQLVEIRGHADRNLREPSNPYSARNRRITITVLIANDEKVGSIHSTSIDSTGAPAGPAPADSAASGAGGM